MRDDGEGGKKKGKHIMCSVLVNFSLRKNANSSENCTLKF